MPINQASNQAKPSTQTQERVKPINQSIISSLPFFISSFLHRFFRGPSCTHIFANANGNRIGRITGSYHAMLNLSVLYFHKRKREREVRGEKALCICRCILRKWGCAYICKEGKRKGKKRKKGGKECGGGRGMGMRRNDLDTKEKGLNIISVQVER